MPMYALASKECSMILCTFSKLSCVDTCRVISATILRDYEIAESQSTTNWLHSKSILIDPVLNHVITEAIQTCPVYNDNTKASEVRETHAQ